MTVHETPKNLLQYHMNLNAAKSVSAKIIEEAQKLPRHLTPEEILAASQPELCKIETRDASGRVITTFEGNCSAWLNDFSMVPKRVISIKTK
jgi:hypothetical protein